MTNNETQAFAVAFYNTLPNWSDDLSNKQWLNDREEIKQLLNRYNSDFDEARFDEASENGYCLPETT